MAEEDSLDLLHEIQEIQGSEFLVFTTYSFDPVFFENSILRIIKQNNPGVSILVMVDMDVYEEAMKSGTEVTGVEYALMPIPGALFHPKLILSLSESRQLAYVGSHNLTLSGIAHNMELTCKIDDPRAIGRILDYVKSILKRYVEGDSYWLQKLQEYYSGSHTRDSDPLILHNLDNSIIDLLKKEIKNGNLSADEIFVAAPFFSHTRALIEQLKNVTRAKKVNVCIQPHNHTLDPTGLEAPWISFYDIQLAEQRRFHSKLILFKSKNGTRFLLGSPNFTRPALELTAGTGNYELALLGTCAGKILNSLHLRPTSIDQVRSSIREDTSLPASMSSKRPIAILNAYLDHSSRLVLDIYSERPIDGTLVACYGETNDKWHVMIHQQMQRLEYPITKPAHSVYISGESGIVSNTARVYLPTDRQRQIAKIAKANAAELAAMVATAKNVSELMQYLQAIFLAYYGPRVGPRVQRKPIGPAPAKDITRHVVDLLDEIIRLIPHDRTPREPGPIVCPDGPVSGDTYVGGRMDERIERALNRLSEALAEKWIARNNSAGAYLFYVLFNLRLLMELGIQNANYHLGRLFERLGSVVTSYHIGAIDSEQALKLVALVRYLYDSAGRNPEREQTFGLILSEAGEAVRAILIPNGDFLGGARVSFRDTLRGMNIIVPGEYSSVEATCRIVLSDKLGKERVTHLLRAMETPISDNDFIYLSKLLLEFAHLDPEKKKQISEWVKEQLQDTDLRPFIRHILEEDVAPKVVYEDYVENWLICGFCQRGVEKRKFQNHIKSHYLPIIAEVK